MSEKFEQFRLSLLLRAQRDAFAPAPDPTREDYLRKAFTEEYVMERRGGEFHYIPGASSGVAVLGRIGRRVVIEENLSPAEGLAETLHRGWKASVVVLDPTDHDDGQRIAVEVDRQVGAPSALLRGLVDTINSSHPLAPYHIEVQPIFDARSFWHWVEVEADRVTSVSFDMVAPNGIFTAKNSVRTELRAAKENSGANKVGVKLQNDEGLKVRSAAIGEAVEYTERSGGRIRAKAKNGKKFDSNDRPATTTLEGDSSDSPVIVRAAEHVTEILGRE